MPRPRLSAEALAPEAPKRARLKLPDPAPSLADEYESSCEFLPSGSTLLDQVLGGGWAQSRIINLVGDRSSGKTLLAIEACANFAAKFKAKDICYAEAEAAFDSNYAKSIGLPDGVHFLTEEEQFDTVEGWYEHFKGWLTKRKSNQGPCLYILDSMDALSDDAEMKREIGEGSFGAAKAKKLSELFRRIVRLAQKKQCTLIVISQLREAIGVMFGEKHRRSGGKALDFYCSQIVWLAERGKIKQKVRGKDYTIGLNVLARTKKNKVGIPFRDANLTIIFSYGVDDEISMLDWLKEQKAENLIVMEPKACREAIMECRKNGERDALADISDDLKAAVRKRWRQIEKQLAPTMKKYGA